MDFLQLNIHLESISLSTLSSVLFLTILVCSWYYLKNRCNTKTVDTSHNVLLITAHPDDELMFFGPTLLHEIRSRIQSFNHVDVRESSETKRLSKVHIVCLSNGNYYGDGFKRQKELFDACDQLLESCSESDHEHLLAEEIFQWKVLDDPKLLDSPEAEWPLEHLLMIVEDYIEKHRITKLITFDQYGISGHPNHIALFETVRKLDTNRTKKSFGKELQIQVLESVSIFRKYLALFDIVFTIIQAWWTNNWNVYFVSSLKDYLNLVRSLRKHQSQMLWFRYLYSSTSRYMFINNYKTINEDF